MGQEDDFEKEQVGLTTQTSISSAYGIYDSFIFLETSKIPKRSETQCEVSQQTE